MARVKRGVHAKKKHKAIMKKAKGYFGDRSRTFRSQRSGNARRAICLS